MKKEVNNVQEKVNEQFNTSLRRTKKYTLYINPSFIFDNNKKVKEKTNNFNKFKRSKSNSDLIIKHFTEKIKDNKKNILNRNNCFEKSRSKKNSNYYNLQTNTVNML